MADDKKIFVTESSNGTHINIYSNDPREPHDSIHINIPEGSTGQAGITTKFGSEKAKRTKIDLNK